MDRFTMSPLAELYLHMGDTHVVLYLLPSMLLYMLTVTYSYLEI
jgi:hypothetical protein